MLLQNGASHTKNDNAHTFTLGTKDTDQLLSLK
jgi:hypothetical protein